MPTKNTARKLAQRAVPMLERCEECGGTDGLERHHDDYSRPKDVRVLCQTCHIKADQAIGVRSTKKQKLCAICGTLFMPRHSKKHSTCSPACLSEAGRRNASKRWGSSGQKVNGPTCPESPTA